MISNIPLPKLLTYNSTAGRWDVEREIHPVSVGINLNITPLSDAEITMPQDENLPARGYVELFTALGSAGVYRVRSPQDAYGESSTTAELEHAIVEVGDYLVLAEYKEMVAASTAMQRVFSHYRGNKWQLGSVAALGSGQIALKTNYDRILEAMLSILDQKPDCMMAFDFTTTPWTVSIVSRDTTVTAEGRLARNINYARVIYDDTELCTRAYYEHDSTVDSKHQQTSAWKHIDASTQSQYGVVERTVSTGSNYSESEADVAAQIYLDKHKKPRVSVEISAFELSDITGESIDNFAIGKLFRLALEDYGATVEENITSLSWDDVYNAPYSISVVLADEEDTAITFLHDIDSKGGSGGGGGGRKQDEVEKKVFAEFINLENLVGMVVGTYSGEHKIKAGEITLSINETTGESRALIDANHINISATDDAHLLAGSIIYDAYGNLVLNESSGGGIVVRRTEQGTTSQFGIWDRGNLNGGVMVQQINGQSNVKISGDVIDINGSSITISADRVDLSAYVTISELEATDARISNLISGATTASTLRTQLLAAQTGFDYQGLAVTWRSKSVVTGVTPVKTTSKAWALADGTSWTGQLMESVSASTITIHYLGGDDT